MNLLILGFPSKKKKKKKKKKKGVVWGEIGIGIQ